MSVRLSNHPRGTTVAPTGRIFMKFDILGFLENLAEKFKCHFNLARIMGILHEYLCMCVRERERERERERQHLAELFL
jgi:hypothetical protein